MKKTCYKIMFQSTEEIFTVLLSNIVNGSNVKQSEMSDSTYPYQFTS